MTVTIPPLISSYPLVLRSLACANVMLLLLLLLLLQGQLPCLDGRGGGRHWLLQRALRGGGHRLLPVLGDQPQQP